MFLFSEDEDKRVSSLLSRLANYDDAIQPVEMEQEKNGAPKPAQKKANLGVLTGVYLPCIQNIFGVIIFIRMTWMTGTAGVSVFFAIVLLCCSVTLCTVSHDCHLIIVHYYVRANLSLASNQWVRDQFSWICVLAV